MNPRMKRLLWLAPLILPAFALFVALGGWVVRELWNWLLPPLFGWKAITFWQALGLLALCRILFGGFGGRGGPRPRARDRIAERIDERVRERMAERWGRATSEERGRGPGAAGSTGGAPAAGERTEP